MKFSIHYCKCGKAVLIETKPKWFVYEWWICLRCKAVNEVRHEQIQQTTG